MNALGNSLCASCEHLIYCSLTSDKRFIWSCSDYEATGVLNSTFHRKITIDPKGVSSSGGESVLV